MPLKVTLNGVEKWLQPKTEWTKMAYKSKDLKVAVDPNFYVTTLKSLK
jgi:hypothetical protein